MTCPVCDHEHVRFLEYALEEEPELFKFLAYFFEVPMGALSAHMDHCTNRSTGSVEPVQGVTAHGA